MQLSPSVERDIALADAERAELAGQLDVALGHIRKAAARDPSPEMRRRWADASRAVGAYDDLAAAQRMLGQPVTPKPEMDHAHVKSLFEEGAEHHRAGRKRQAEVAWAKARVAADQSGGALSLRPPSLGGKVSAVINDGMLALSMGRWLTVYDIQALPAQLLWRRMFRGEDTHLMPFLGRGQLSVFRNGLQKPFNARTGGAETLKLPPPPPPRRYQLAEATTPPRTLISDAEGRERWRDDADWTVVILDKSDAAVVWRNGVFKVIDLDDGSAIVELPKRRFMRARLARRSDDRQFAVVRDDELAIVDLPGGRVRTMKQKAPINLTYDGEWLYAIGPRSVARIDPRTARLAGVTDVSGAPGFPASQVQRGRYLRISDGTAYVWDVEQGGGPQRLFPPVERIVHLAADPGARYALFVAASGAGLCPAQVRRPGRQSQATRRGRERDQPGRRRTLGRDGP